MVDREQNADTDKEVVQILACIGEKEQKRANPVRKTQRRVRYRYVPPRSRMSPEQMLIETARLRMEHAQQPIQQMPQPHKPTIRENLEKYFGLYGSLPKDVKKYRFGDIEDLLNFTV